MKKIVVGVLFLGLLFISCNDDDGFEVPQDLEIQDFVWKGMNSWYNWQAETTNLADDIDNNSSAYVDFLDDYATPEAIFGSLLYQPGITDRFSWIVDDYIALNNSFQGIRLSYGLRLQTVILDDNNPLTDNDVIVYVRYVAPNSPASDALIARGDIINAVNGVTLKESNYDNALDGFDNGSISLTLVTEDNGVLTTIETKEITSRVITENPVHFFKVFDNIGGEKVGYLVYNRFRSSYNDELNSVFEFFKSEGINELILDLRLNGGGSVETCAYLASMIYADGQNDTFAELKFNAKHTNQNNSYSFEDNLTNYNADGDETGTEVINRLNTLNQVYVLISGSTASASEMIINGLTPFMPVKLVGSTTSGKNVGSITLYDSPSSDFTRESTANPSHLYAMQPIVFQIFNKDGQSDYTQGFDPSNGLAINEYEYWNAILPFGDENEVVLKTALDDIRGFSLKQITKSHFNILKSENPKQLEERFDKEMYINSNFFNSSD